MFDVIPLYAFIGGLLALALAVVAILLLLRRFYLKRRTRTTSEKRLTDDAEKAFIHEPIVNTNKVAEFSSVTPSSVAVSDNCKQRLLANYGSSKRTLSMDSINVKQMIKTQSIQHPLKTSAPRQQSFPSPAARGPYENALCERVPEDESVDEYDNHPPFAMVERTSSRTTSASSSGVGVLRRQSSTSSGTEASIGAIKPDLYLRKGSFYHQHSDGDASSCIGKVHLRFRYDFRRSDFIVTAMQVELPEPIQDCYLRMFLIPDDSDSGMAGSGGPGGSSKGYRQSKVRHRSTAFAFNEELKFAVAFSELMDKMLVVQVFDCSMRSSSARAHQQVGEVCLELQKADPSADIEVLADLTKIRVKEDIYGSIEVALSYLPSVQRLTITILQAKGLQIDELNDHASGLTVVYVRCMLFQNGSKTPMKKKKTALIPVVIPRPEQESTSVDVSWKEQLTFQLPEKSCKSATLRLSVCAKHTKGGSEKILGQINLGSEEASRECRQHWRQMLKEKFESAVWHKLRIPATEPPSIATRTDSIRSYDCD